MPRIPALDGFRWISSLNCALIKVISREKVYAYRKFKGKS